MGVISWTAGQALWVLLAGQRDRHCGCTAGQALLLLARDRHSVVSSTGTGTVGVVSSTLGQALWVLLAPQWDRHWGCC